MDSAWFCDSSPRIDRISSGHLNALPEIWKNMEPRRAEYQALRECYVAQCQATQDER